MSKGVSTATIVSQSELIPGIFDLVIETPLAGEAAPGRFLALYCNDGSRLLPRPISICDADSAAGTIRLVYRAVGGGTREFSGMKAGETLRVLGVLGSGYPVGDVSGKNILLVGGGLGIPPLLFLAGHLKGLAGSGNEPATVSAVIGYRSIDQRFLDADLGNLADMTVASDDGSLGFHGTVVDAIRDKELKPDIVYSCGPMPMLKALASLCGELNTKCYVSLEERMACGVGVCLGCVTKTTRIDEHSRVRNTRICTEGPVFDAKDIEW